MAACLLIPGSAAGFSGHVLRGFGTATIDGYMSPGEWNAAGRADFTMNRAPGYGGGAVPASIYVMNDAANLYIGIQVMNTPVGYSGATLSFDADHDDNSSELGEDVLSVSGDGTFYDRFDLQDQTSGQLDTLYGGTSDGDERDGWTGGHSFYEFTHPLDTADNLHDFSLAAPMTIGFRLSFGSCSQPDSGSCAYSSFPSSSRLAEIVVLTGSRVPPDTQLTSGPAEGSMIADSKSALEFTGSDDVLQPSQLTYECQIDAGAWQQCTSPKEVAVTDGRHTFSVRAVDDMLNVDQSPAQRTWTSDTTGPSKPVIRGRRSVREGRRVVLRFSATDELAGGVTFYCYVKRRPFRRCSAVYRTRKLRRGRNIGLVYAVDRLGNRSKLAAFIIRVKPARR